MANIINGTASGETLTGTTGDDIINGLGGNDTIRAGDGIDQLFGGDGEDTLFGGTGVDVYDGGNGSGDYLGADAAALTGISATFTGIGTGTYHDVYGNTESFVNIEQIGGTTLADTVTFGAGDNLFLSFGGNDVVVGGDGFDNLVLTNSAGNGWNSSFNPTSGATVNFITGIITGGYAATTITFSGFERVRGTNFADTFIGGNDTHAVYSFRGLGGADSYTGGTGANDQVDYSGDGATGGLAGVTVDLAAGTATDGFGNAETMTGIEGVRGTAQTDTISGNAADNTLNGMSGNDTINGGDGDDGLYGGSGFDTLNGGNGSDWVANYRDAWYDGATGGIITNLAANSQMDSFGNFDTLSSIENVSASKFADMLTGNDGDNIFRGYDGDDTINGGAGLDAVQAYSADILEAVQDELGVHLRGTQGWTVTVADGNGTVIDQFGNTDTLTSIERFRATMLADTFNGGAGTQYFQGLAGNDTFNGGDGEDWVEYSADVAFGATGGINANLGTGVAIDGFGNTDSLSGIENLRGSDLNDIIVGSTLGNALKGGAGTDVIYGMEGNDTLTGGTALAGQQNQLWGGTGTDTADYASETGVVYVDLRANAGYVDYGAGFVLVDLMNSVENVRGGSGNDLIVGADGVDNRLIGAEGSDVLYGMGGDDTLIGGTAPLGMTNQLWGGTGTDTADYSDNTSGVIADLRVLAAYVDSGAGYVLNDQMNSIENLIGGHANDQLIGSDSDNNRLVGGDGADVLYGMGGDDTLVGGTAPTGMTNQLWGGTGADTADYATETGALYVDLRANYGMINNGAGFVLTDLYNSIENLAGGTGSDVLIGTDADNNVLSGGAGADILYGMDGNDTLTGGTTLAGQVNQLWGGNGTDTAAYAYATTAIYVDINQNAGWVRDTGGTLVLTDLYSAIENIIGGSAADVIVGDTGANRITGGAGGDILYGNIGAGTDSAVDTFVYTAAADSNTATGYDTLVNFQTGQDRIDLSAFGITSANVLISSSGGATAIYANVDANPGYDLAISVLGSNAVVMGDLIF